MFDYLIYLDRWLFHFFNQTLSAEWLDPIAKTISGKYIWIPLYGFIVYLFIKEYRMKAFVPVLCCFLAFGLSDSISTRVFKQGFKRTRPCNVAELHARTPGGKSTSYGFVSSHAANTASFYLLVVLFTGARRYRALLWLLIPLAIGWSRVYLGVHYPADVFGGWLLGIFLAYSIYLAAQRIFHLNTGST